MYKIKGADEKEYGPVSAEQILKWVAEGRLNGRTPVRLEGTAEWKFLSDFPELRPPGFAAPPLPGTGAAPATFPTAYAGAPSQGLAIASFVLGLLSLVCLSVLGGIPAIICGHIAHARAKRLPSVYGGAGFAIAGFITGYLSLVMAVIAVTVFSSAMLPGFSNAKQRAQDINCVNNMKQIGLAFKVWAIDNGDQYPFNVSTNKGGTCEYCLVGKDGFDANASFHFRALSNELSVTKILVCPADSKTAASSFIYLRAMNISYQLHSGTNYSDEFPQAVLAVCPIHGNVLLCDGSVQRGRLKPVGNGR